MKFTLGLMEIEHTEIIKNICKFHRELFTSIAELKYDVRYDL